MNTSARTNIGILSRCVRPPSRSPAPAESRHSTLGLAGPIVDDTLHRFYRQSHQAFPTPMQTIACLFAARIVGPRQVPWPMTTIVLTSFLWRLLGVECEKSPSGRVYVGISTKNMAPPPARKKLCHFSECVAKTRQKRRPSTLRFSQIFPTLGTVENRKKAVFESSIVSILVR